MGKKLVKIKNIYVPAGKTGLPLPSKLDETFLGTKMKDEDGDVRKLCLNTSGVLYWAVNWKNADCGHNKKKSPKKRSPRKKKKTFSQTRKMFYRREIEKNLDDEDEIRDIFIEVIEELNE